MRFLLSIFVLFFISFHTLSPISSGAVPRLPDNVVEVTASIIDVVDPITKVSSQHISSTFLYGNPPSAYYFGNLNEKNVSDITNSDFSSAVCGGQQGAKLLKVLDKGRVRSEITEMKDVIDILSQFASPLSNSPTPFSPSPSPLTSSSFSILCPSDSNTEQSIIPMVPFPAVSHRSAPLDVIIKHKEKMDQMKKLGMEKEEGEDDDELYTEIEDNNKGDKIDITYNGKLVRSQNNDVDADIDDGETSPSTPSGSASAQLSSTDAEAQWRRNYSVQAGGAVYDPNSEGTGKFFTWSWPWQTDTPKEFPYEGLDFASITWASDEKWAREYFSTHFGDLHKFNVWDKGHSGIFDAYTGKQMKHDDTILPLFPTVTMGIAADWGAGTKEAQYVADAMMEDFPAHYTFHMGDVYYVGVPQEIKACMLGMKTPHSQRGVLFPHGTMGAFAIEGNHEVLSRSYGFFDTLLPTMGTKNGNVGMKMNGAGAVAMAKFYTQLKQDGYRGEPLSGQQAGYFAIYTEHWRMIALDTGYTSYSHYLPFSFNQGFLLPAIVAWLKNTVHLNNANDKRGIIIYTHHQPLSAFGESFPTAAHQLADIVPAGRQIVWLFGHEHLFSIFHPVAFTAKSGAILHFHGRCIGNGGFPADQGKSPTSPGIPWLKMYDDRLYTHYYGSHSVSVGYNGFVRQRVTGRKLELSYHSLSLNAEGDVQNHSAEEMINEVFEVDENGHVTQAEFYQHNMLMIKVKAEEPKQTYVPPVEKTGLANQIKESIEEFH